MKFRHFKRRGRDAGPDAGPVGDEELREELALGNGDQKMCRVSPGASRGVRGS